MDKNNLSKMRHSAEHVLTQAMLKLYPGLLMAMGPATEDGFYFDFDYKEKISEEDFPKIEAEMQKIIKKDLPIKKEEMRIAAARKLFANNPYKQEWLDEIEAKGEKATVYWTGEDFVDLCSGPHMASTGEIGPFKLLSVAGAYWRGSEKNKMLTRIYGTSFSTQEELDEYISREEEAKEKDHRKIGKKLGLFVFSDLVGKGLPLFTPKGATIRRELERFIVDEELKRGYQHVYTPSLAKTELYKTSGHYPYYKDTMYPVMKVDEDELILRPMTCPHHFMLYKSEPRSYRDLPLRIAEISPQFRYEKSGELTGLMRVRMFCLADAHIICKPSDAKEEIKSVLDLIDFVNKTLGMKKGEDYRYRLSLGSRRDEKKYYKDDAAWDKAEEVLRSVLVETEAPFYEAENEAAFYGPKIDVQVKNVAGKEETAFTVQYDFVMPKRFDLKYIDTDGTEKEVVVIHRSSLGAFERTMAFLIEKYNGNFPTWLAPIQVKILPVSEKVTDYAQEVLQKIKDVSIRVELDSRNETLGAKIRDAQAEKVPYMIIVGEKESQNQTVSVRLRNGKDLGAQPLDELLGNIKDQIEKRALD